MAKFDFKGIAKSGMENGKAILPITAGIIGAQKFIDFRTIFPKVDPNEWYIKHQGGIKFGGALVTLAMWKKMPVIMKWLLWGIAIQGAIQETKTLTVNKEGKAFFDGIGAGEYNKEMEEMADNIKKLATERVSGPAPITDNNYSSVAGMGANNPSVLLQMNSETGVNGIGSDDEYMRRYAA
jgi:hypothetical protein